MENLGSMTNIIIIATILIVGLLFIFRFGTGILTRNWNRHRAETIDLWESEGVNFVKGPQSGQFSGLDSQGLKRVRGIGYIVLTDQDVRLTRAVPSESWIITHRQIKGVALQHGFAGHRTKNTPQLVIRFTKDSVKDKIGFVVKEPQEWADAIAKAAGVSIRDKTTSDDAEE